MSEEINNSKGQFSEKKKTFLQINMIESNDVGSTKIIKPRKS